MVELRFVNGEWRPARLGEVHPAPSVTTSMAVQGSQLGLTARWVRAAGSLLGWQLALAAAVTRNTGARG